MQLPNYYEYGDEDESLVEFVPERRLYLSVFMQAYYDLTTKKGALRSNAIKWFREEIHHPYISFSEVKDLFKISSTRLDNIDRHIHTFLKAKIRVRMRINILRGVTP